MNRLRRFSQNEVDTSPCRINSRTALDCLLRNLALSFSDDFLPHVSDSRPWDVAGIIVGPILGRSSAANDLTDVAEVFGLPPCLHREPPKEPSFPRMRESRSLSVCWVPAFLSFSRG